ncbi:MAG: hypothetical protein IKY51_02765 [Alistipes sp.]|nr:hypothetical protein [Alistipes sp.]
MKLNRVISAILLVCAMVMAQSASAQLKTSYFMEGSYFRTDMNPALAPTRGYIALPLLSGFSAGVYSNYNSYENMYYEQDGVYVGALNSSVPADEFLSKLPNQCVQALDINLSLFKLGFYTLHGTFFNVGANMRVNYNTVIPKDYFKMVKGENEESINIKNMSIDLDQYLETYAGTAIRLGENITVGARFKFLIGLQNGVLNVDKLSVENGNYSIHGDIKMNSYMYDSSQYNGDPDNIAMLDESFSTIKDNLHSFGGAIDLGAEVRLFEKKLKLSAAVTDLGFITWSSKSQLRGSINCDANEDMGIEELLNLEVVNVPNKLSDYATRLTTNVNIGAEYNFLCNHFAVGLLSHTRLYRNAVATELTTSFNVRPTNWMTFTASHTFFNGNTPGIYGAAVNIHPRAINIFFGMDYIGSNKNSTDFEPTTMAEIDHMLSPKATSYNFYIGVGFNFGRPDFLVEQ